MANIIANHCQSEDKIIQKIALKWLDVFLDLAGRVMLRFTANILIAVLPCLAYTGDKEDIRRVASNVNRKLKELILPTDDDDTNTDLTDQIQVNLMTGSPGINITPTQSPKSSPTRIRKQVVSGKTTSPKTSKTSTNVAPPTKVTPPTQTAPPIQPTLPTQTGINEVGSNAEGPDTGEVGVVKFSLLTVLGVLMPHMSFTEQETKLETLRWLLWLHDKLPKRYGRQVCIRFSRPKAE
uniref:Uncharacterized protein n=1 Tax=Amphimedon queenslandica TaxID=400682 RepID=A0A1X7SNC0_AMPQE